MVKTSEEHFDVHQNMQRLRQTIDGKRKSFYGKTKKECRRKRDDYLATLENGGTDVCKDFERITVSQYCKEWLYRSKYRAIGARYYDTLDQSLSYVEGYELGEKVITDVVKQDFHDHYVTLAAKYSVSTIKKAHSLLCQCFDYANEMGHTNVSPRGIELPKEDAVESKKKGIEILDDKYMMLMANEWKRKNTEQCRINGKIGTPVYKGTSSLIVVLIMFTGMRISEALGLKKKNIDLDNGLVTIDSQVNRVSDRDESGNRTGKKHLDEHTTKTERGTRVFPLNKYSKEIVEELMRLNYSDTYLCTTDKGTIPQESNLRRSLHAMLTRIGAPVDISHFGVHDCRHTYASFLLRHGVRYDIVAKWLGHDVETLIKTYSHIIAAEEIKAMNIFSGTTQSNIEETDMLNDLFN